MPGVLVAFGHYFAFFALTAAIVVTLTLLSESMTLEAARRIRRADRIAGLAALLLLVFGTLRVLYFEKGGAYYLDNLFFQVKFALFLLAALISIYPTTRFFGWRHDLARDTAPLLNATEVKRLRRALHWELILIGAILFCASLMARGFGN